MNSLCFKNFKKKLVVAQSKIGGHVIRFNPGEEKIIPAHLEELCLENGLVPMDEITAKIERENTDEAAEAKAKAAADAIDAATTAKIEAEALTAQAEKKQAQSRVATAKAKNVTKK